MAIETKRFYGHPETAFTTNGWDDLLGDDPTR